MFSESYSSSFSPLIFLPFFCLFFFLSQLIFNSSYWFTLVHLSSLKFGWNPSERCVLSFSSFPELSVSSILYLAPTKGISLCLSRHPLASYQVTLTQTLESSFSLLVTQQQSTANMPILQKLLLPQIFLENAAWSHHFCQ